MNDSLSKLKQAMKQTVFKDISLSNERKNAVMAGIWEKQSKTQLNTWKEDTLIAVFKSIQTEAKQGFDIATYLIKKNDIHFKNKEGQLYILLHLLESKEIIASNWSEGKKYYFLTSKGKKYLAVCKRESPKRHESLRSLLEEVSL